MKKLLLLLPLFAGASWAGTTYYSGTQTQPAYNRLLEQLNAIDFLTVTQKEYNNGFLNSTAITEVVFNETKKQTGDTKQSNDAEASTQSTLFLHHDISHSPISMIPANARFGAAEIVTTLMVDKIEDEKARKMLSTFKNGTPFVLTTNVEIDGETKNELTLHGINFVDGESTLESTGGVVNMLTTPNGLYEGDMTFGPSTAFIDDGGDPMTLEFGEITGKYLFQQIDELLFDVLVDFNMESASFSEQGNSSLGKLDIKDISANYNVTLTGDSPAVKTRSNVGDISHPMIPLKSLKQDFVLDGFSADALTEYSAQIRQWSQAAANGNTSGAEPTPEQITDIIQRTLLPGTSVKNHTHATTVDGDLDAAIEITFLGNGTATGYEGMVSIGDLARTIGGTVAIKADTDAVMNSFIGPMLIGSPAANYFVIGDDTITLDAKLDNLKLNVNGETIPLELMIGHMLDAPLSSLF